MLVTSFNDMARRLARARQDMARSQQAVEAERGKLAAILARLSTGVLSLEPNLDVRVANQAAGLILGVDLESAVGRQLAAVTQGLPLAEQFVDAVHRHLDAGQLLHLDGFTYETVARHGGFDEDDGDVGQVAGWGKGEGWFRVDLRSGWIQRAEVLFIKPK